MKKIIIGLCVALFIGCSNDDDPKVTTVQFVNNIEMKSGDVDGTVYEVIAFCYEGDDVIKQLDIDPISPGGGITDQIELPQSCEKIKLSFKLVGEDSALYPYADRLYVFAFYMVEKDKNNEFEFNDNTMTSKSLSMIANKQQLKSYR